MRELRGESHLNRGSTIVHPYAYISCLGEGARAAHPSIVLEGCSGVCCLEGLDRRCCVAGEAAGGQPGGTEEGLERQGVVLEKVARCAEEIGAATQEWDEWDHVLCIFLLTVTHPFIKEP